MKLKPTLAVLLAALALPAFAASTDWGAHDAVEVGNGFAAPGSFSDFFSFTLGGTTSLSAVAVANNNTNALHIVQGTVSLYEDVTGPDQLIGSFKFNGKSGDDAHSFANLVAGSYYYLVNGKAVGQSGGVYSLTSAVAAVPEPESYALLLGGLAAIGLVVRRRNGNERS